MEKYIIYSDLDSSEHEQYFREQYPGASDEEIAQMTADDLWYQLNDVRKAFDKIVAPELIAIGDIGRWDGRFCGYHDIPDGKLKHCFFPGRDIHSAEWFLDKRGDLRSEQRHHDGVHYVLYRAFKGENAYEDIEQFKHLIYTGKATQQDIDRYTERLGDGIAKHYGWKIESLETAVSEKPSLRETLAINAIKSREMFAGAISPNPQKAQDAVL